MKNINIIYILFSFLIVYSHILSLAKIGLESVAELLRVLYKFSLPCVQYLLRFDRLHIIK